MREVKQSEAQRDGHVQAEAFCLMLYRDTAGNEEWIWNSRDGVTPFIVTSKGGLESQHVEWYRDRYAPNHKPKPGERIFVNQTFETALPEARKYVDAYWENPDMPMSTHPFFAEMSKEAAAEHFAKSWVGDGNQPTVVEAVEQ